MANKLIANKSQIANGKVNAKEKGERFSDLDFMVEVFGFLEISNLLFIGVISY